MGFVVMFFAGWFRKLWEVGVLGVSDFGILVSRVGAVVVTFEDDLDCGV